MENGWNYPKSGGGNGEHVTQPGPEGEHAINYSTSGSLSGWDKCDDHAGEVGDTGMNGDHFAGADSHTSTHQSTFGPQT